MSITGHEGADPDLRAESSPVATTQFMVLSRRRTEGFKPADFTPALIEREAQHARALYMRGFIRQMWLRGEPDGGACVLVEARSKAEVAEVWASFPLSQAGMLEVVNIIALKPYSGFGPR